MMNAPRDNGTGDCTTRLQEIQMARQRLRDRKEAIRKAAAKLKAMQVRPLFRILVKIVALY